MSPLNSRLCIAGSIEAGSCLDADDIHKAVVVNVMCRIVIEGLRVDGVSLHRCLIVARAAGKSVITFAQLPLCRVIAVSTEQDVIAAAADERVVASVSIKRVDLIFTQQRIVARASMQFVQS